MRAWMHQVLALAFCGPVILLVVCECGGRQGPAAGDGGTPDLAHLSPPQKGIYLSARRGAEWLWRAHRPDGLFLSTFDTGLNVPAAEELLIDQALGAAALARASRAFDDSRYQARARQALLALLARTALDPANDRIRFPQTSRGECKLAAAGIIVLAIHELPAPGPDLLEQSDQLCEFIRSCQWPDGSWKSDMAAEALTLDSEGMALFGLMRSQHHRPSPWKTELAAKSVPGHRIQWSIARNPFHAAWRTAAYAEGYLLTRDQRLAGCAFEWCDWLCTLQFGADPGRPDWQGSFAIWTEADSAKRSPGASTGVFAQAILEGCKAARLAGDARRFQRYRETLERSLIFLGSLQFDSANARQLPEWLRTLVLGGFPATLEDRTVHLRSSGPCVAALTGYVSAFIEPAASPRR